MLILPDIHSYCSTKVFCIFPWGEINKLLTYKSAIVKFPTSLLKHIEVPGRQHEFFIQVHESTHTHSEISLITART